MERDRGGIFKEECGKWDEKFGAFLCFCQVKTYGWNGDRAVYRNGGIPEVHTNGGAVGGDGQEKEDE